VGIGSSPCPVRWIPVFAPCVADGRVDSSVKKKGLVIMLRLQRGGHRKVLKPTAQVAVMLMALSGANLSGGVAEAQLTTEALIGDAVSDPGSSRYSDVGEAIKRFSNRDELGAQQFLENAVRKDPKLPPVDLMLAKMYFLGGNSQAGLAYLEKTVMENAGDPEPLLILGDQAFNTGQTIAAEALYERALTLIDSFQGNEKRKRGFIIRARNGRSAVAERRKNWQTTVDDLNALLKVDPDNAAAHYRLGRALFMLKKAREGYDEFVKASKLDEKLPGPYVTAALMYDQLDSRADAERAFERAVAENRSDAKTLIAYAGWLLKTGDIAKAESMLADARRLEPENLDVLVFSGVAARMAKKMKPAEDYLIAALRLAPTNSAVLNQLALLLIDQPDEQKRQRALEFARINATLEPNSSESNITYAWVLYQLGNARDAEAALRKGLQFGNRSADSNYLIAKILDDQNKPDLARPFLTRAFEGAGSGVFVLREDAEALKAKIGG
jgi:tetratricopeptide (TPR) repeat protein